MAKEMTSTLEDYLETIYRTETRKRVVRPRDICEAQGVAGSTVTAALQSLAERGLINYEPYEFITLTERGRREGEKIATRHLIISDFLQSILRLEAEQAEATACEMEHAVDRRALERFICFVAFMRYHSEQGAGCLEEFREFMAGGAPGCRECVDRYMDALGAKEG